MAATGVTVQKFLESWPLYRKLSYDGSVYSETGEFQQLHRYIIAPNEIRLFCSTCGGQRNWAFGGRSFDQRLFLGSGPRIDTLSYSCRDCAGRDERAEPVHYFVRSLEFKSAISLWKVGQWPPLEIEPSAALAKELGVPDTDFYKRAKINRNSGFGLGAITYLRRILEDKINRLLEMTIEAAKSSTRDAREIQELTAAMPERLTDKVRLAGKLLPEDVKAGHNPFDLLYDLTSDGIHNLTEEEALGLFDECVIPFEHLFEALAVRKATADEYARRMGELARKGTRQKPGD